ncbi:hypothetical protein [Metabacillus indicus]|nr:hypothetical protein [Metabacillus indicus]
MNVDQYSKTIAKTVRYMKREASGQQVLQLEKLLKETIEARLKEKIEKI